MSRKKASHKLDIWKTLSAVDNRDGDFWSNLTDEEKKGFHPPVVLRWASAIKGSADLHEWYLASMNERANLFFYHIYDHPELQFKLMASCGAQTRVQHDWIGNAKGKKQSALYSCISSFWPDANTQEIELLLNSFSEGAFNDFIDGSGMNADDAKKLKKMFKDREI